MKRSAIVAGILALDLTPVLTGPPRGSLLEAFTPGRTTLTEGMNISCGGAVANTGIAMHLFGTEVHLVGRAGIDAFGSVLMREMDYGDKEGGSKDCYEEKGNCSRQRTEAAYGRDFQSPARSVLRRGGEGRAVCLAVLLRREEAAAPSYLDL